VAMYDCRKALNCWLLTGFDCDFKDLWDDCYSNFTGCGS